MKTCTQLFKRSLEERRLLEDWLTPTVIREYKGGDRDSCDSCRPVSLTSIVQKTLQRDLRGRIVNHLEAIELMMIEQHGFWHERSCLINLISLPDEVIDKIDRDEKQKPAIWTFRKPLFPWTIGFLTRN